MNIAREIRVFLFVLLLLAISAKVYFGWIAALALLSIIIPVAWIFRDPSCQVPSAPLAIVSPASGEVISVEPVNDPWLERKAVRIRIRMSFWNAHILRSPIEGKVKNQWTDKGEEKGMVRRYTYWIQTDESDDIVYSIATGSFAPLIRINLRCGERTGQGQKSGCLYFSGITDVLVPENSRLVAKPGDAVDSGSSILAQILHDPSNRQDSA